MTCRLCSLAIVCFVFLGFCPIHGEESTSKITFRAQTKEEEFLRIKQTIAKLPWLKQHGYSFTLPQHKSFEGLYREAEKYEDPDVYSSPYFPDDPHFPKEEYFQNIFFSEIYDINSYAKGLSLLSAGKKTVEKALEKLVVLQRNWGFKLMPKYYVLLTLYGAIGGYDFSKSLIFVKTTPEGMFFKYGPSETMVRQLIHIGMEENIVKKFRLTQLEKEYLVDAICSTYFTDLLPDYKVDENIAKMLHPERKGSSTVVPDIAGFVNEETIVQNLPLAIFHFVTAHPR